MFLAANKGTKNSITPKQLVSKTFNANGTWVAPNDVTLVDYMEGKGQDGSAGYWYTGMLSWMLAWAYPDSNNGTLGTEDWSVLYNSVLNDVNSSNAQGTGVRNTSGWQRFHRFGPNGQKTTQSSDYYYSSYQTRGTTSIQSSGGAKTSGTITYADAQNYPQWYGYGEQYQYGSTGSSSTALGRTFPGGTESSPTAPTTYFYNTTVVPGTSYTITVPSGGYVYFYYYTSAI